MPQTYRPNDWEQLVRDHENRCYRAALAILGDAAEAEDAVQDAFLKLLLKRPAFDRPDQTGAWLLRVTVNRCKDLLRAAWRRKTVPLDETLPAADPAEREELSELLALPPLERACIHLYYYEGLSTAQIAAVTGSAEGSVRSRLSRARKKLRTLLAEKEEL